MVWYFPVFKNFPQFVVIHTVQGFSIVSEEEVGVFSGILLLLPGSIKCWQFDLWFLCLFEAQIVHLEVCGSHTA